MNIKALGKLYGQMVNLLGLDERRCRNCLTPFVPSNQGEELCPICLRYFVPYRGPACPGCGEPPFARHCSACLTGRPWIAHAFHGLYRGPLRDLIHRLKYDGELALAPFLASLLLEASICLPKPDAIVPLPQYPPQLGQRGFNQTHEIGRWLSRASGIPMRAHLLKRVMHTRRQASLSREERKANVKDNFVADPKARGKSVWLLDDVMTTGSTLEAASHALLDAGCTRVSVLFVARTPLD